MVQYLMLLLNNMTIKFGEAIDAGFANSLSIGTICVFAILGSIQNLLVAFYEYGMYYFRVFGVRAKAGLVFNISVATVISVLFELFAKYVKYIFYIDPEYEQLLINCLMISFSYFPFRSATCFIRDYLVYSGKEKITSISTAIYYLFLILFDAIAVIHFHSAEYVLIGTVICDIVSAIVLYNVSGLKDEKFKCSDIVIVLKDGFPMFYNRILSKTSILLINIFASRLGTIQYAIVSVCRKSLEVSQMALQPILPMLITKFRGKKEVDNKLLKSIKNILPVSILIFIIAGVVSLVIVKGDLKLGVLIVPTLISSTTSCVTYLLYTVMEARLSISNETKLIKNSGTIRMSVTFVICLLSLVSFINYWTILLYSTITDLFVGLYSYINIYVVKDSKSK